MSPRCGSIALRLLTARFSSDDKRVWLSFFERTPRNVELTDEYLTEIEGLLRVAFDKTFALAVVIGAT